MRRITGTLMDREKQIYRRGVVRFALVGIALTSLLAVGLTGETAVSVSAQISPLSPLYAVSGDSPALTLVSLHKVNVMASGQTALARLSFVLVGIIIGAGVFVWRRS